MKRVLVMNNVRSGQGDSSLYDYVHALGQRGAEVTLRFTTAKADVWDVLGWVDVFDRVVAAGGDGTVSAVAYALRDSGIPIVAFPAGTANLVALNLGLPADPVALADLTLEGPHARIDVGEILSVGGGDGTPLSPEGRAGFVMAAGAGFDAKIMESARELKSTFGVGAYVVAALQNLAPTHSRFELTLDGRTVETEGIAVLVTNFARVQFDLAVSPASDAQDGVFEVIVPRTKSAAGLIPAVWAAVLDRVRTHPGRRPSLEYHTAREISVVADPPLPVQYDGEVVSGTTPLVARALPGAATFVVPETERFLKLE